jgi:hypothetical protein
MDMLDLLNPKNDYYFTGYYYPHYPSTPEDGRVTFNYRQINPYSRAFATVMNTVRLDAETYAIRTNEDCGFEIKGYISTQDGKFWLIEEIIHNEQVPGAEEALRLFKSVVQSEYLMRLVKMDNPWEVAT